MPPALSLRAVGMTYGTNPPVLDGVDLDIEEGQLACLLGPSGSGKTTLLRAVAGFERADGEILVDGVAIDGPSHERVVVFQDANSALFPWLSVRENVEYPLRSLPRAERDPAAVDRLLALVGLQQHGDKRIHEISGGMRPRTQRARAYAARPRMLLMDEPFGALDALTRLEMQREVAKIVADTGMTVLFVTHDVMEAAMLGDRVFVLGRGPRSNVVATLDNPITGIRTLSEAAVGEFADEILGHILEPAHIDAEGAAA